MCGVSGDINNPFNMRLVSNQQRENRLMAFNTQNLSYKYRQFMSRRNGPDQLARDVFILSIVLIVLSLPFGSIFLTLGLAAIIYAYFRMFSSNRDARSRENAAYLAKRHELAQKLHLTGVKNPFAGFGAASQRAAEQAARKSQKAAAKAADKDHKYLKCPKCKQEIRVPKGAGKIRITCPKCQEKFEKKV